MARLTWQQKLEVLAERLGEPELLSVIDEVDTPLLHIKYVERIMYKVHKQLIREMRPEQIDALGEKAVRAYSLFNGDQIDLKVVKVLGASIDGAPAESVSETMYFTREQSATSTTAIYTFINRRVRFIGNFLSLLTMIEPTLADFRNDLVNFPESLDTAAIDRTYHYLQFVISFNDGRI